MATTLLGLLVQTTILLWIIGFGFSLLLQQKTPYLQWTQNSMVSLWRNHWKLLVGIVIGWVLSVPGTITLFVH